MHRKTAASVSVNVATISGDGNCLFRALSHAVTRSQEQHDLLRLYVTNYMANSEIAQKLKQLFANGDRPDEAHESHILTMQEPGQWGTEEEIVTAAHLLECSILCYSKIFHKQVLPPALPTTFHRFHPCTSSCKHETS